MRDLFDETNVNKVFMAAGTRERTLPTDTQKGISHTAILGIIIVALTLLCIYATFRGASLFNPGYRAVDRAFAILLLLAEFFVLFQAFGYLTHLVRALRRYKATRRVFASSAKPPVAVVIASFNEDPQMLEETIATAASIDYPNKTIFLLDDSTMDDAQKGSQDIAGRYGITYVHRTNRRGYKAGAINDLIGSLEAKYIAIFDADQKATPDFLRELVTIMEENERLAFVQTPQFYANTEHSPVAKGASFQQAVFYECICEAKSTSNAMFCCGTNFIARLDALRAINGFDETSVTEDFATSVRLHIGRWQTMYYNKVFAYGLGPETLGGYFTQQARWALGNIGIFKKILSLLLHHPHSLSFAQWWEYLLSSSYYFIGWTHLVLILTPIAYILFGVRALIANSLYYFSAFVPYFIVSLFVYYLSMGMRGYRMPNLFRGQSIGFISFWVLITSSIVALLGKKRAFGVTPKGKTGKLPLRYLAPQLLMLALSLLAAGVGIYRFLATADYAMLINIFWVLYHSIILGTVFYFNRAFTGYPDAHIFKEGSWI